MKDKTTMKQVKNRTVYDTDKATLILESGEGDNRVRLFKTAKGNWFFLCVDNGKEWINPWDDITTMDWLEEFGYTDVLLEHFESQLYEA